MKYDQLDITTSPNGNVGGICKVQFAPVEDIDSIAEPSLISGKITSAVQFNAGKDWHTLEGTLNSLDYKEPQAENDGGTYHKQTLKGAISKDDLERNVALNGMGYKDFIVLYHSRNGSIKLIGTLDFPLSFTSSLDTAKSGKGREEYEFAFFGEALEKAPHYDV